MVIPFYRTDNLAEKAGSALTLLRRLRYSFVSSKGWSSMNTVEVTRTPGTGVPATTKVMNHAYGFDDVAIVPGAYTVNPDLTDVSLTLGDFSFQIPILASATA